MLPKTTTRVNKATSGHVNEKIKNQTEENIRYFSKMDGWTIRKRLEELDREWDIERTLEANAAAVSLAGLILSLKNRKFIFFPMTVAAFLFQHALQGWCPPVPIFRRLGIRTASEIDKERYALKALRGDFSKVSKGQGNGQRAEVVLDALEK